MHRAGRPISPPLWRVDSSSASTFSTVSSNPRCREVHSMLVAMNLPITSGDVVLSVWSAERLDTSGFIGRVTFLTKCGPSPLRQPGTAGGAMCGYIFAVCCSSASGLALWTCQSVEESLTTCPRCCRSVFFPGYLRLCASSWSLHGSGRGPGHC